MIGHPQPYITKRKKRLSYRIHHTNGVWTRGELRTAM